MKNMNVAIDEVRRTESCRTQARRLPANTQALAVVSAEAKRDPADPQAAKLDELLKYNLKSVKAMLMREDFQQFWTYFRPSCAMKFLDSWCGQVKDSGLKPMTKNAKSLQRHRRLLANWFCAKRAISSDAHRRMPLRSGTARPAPRLAPGSGIPQHPLSRRQTEDRRRPGLGAESAPGYRGARIEMLSLPCRG
jgi:transposase